LNADASIGKSPLVRKVAAHPRRSAEARVERLDRVRHEDHGPDLGREAHGMNSSRESCHSLITAGYLASTSPRTRGSARWPRRAWARCRPLAGLGWRRWCSISRHRQGMPREIGKATVRPVHVGAEEPPSQNSRHWARLRIGVCNWVRTASDGGSPVWSLFVSPMPRLETCGSTFEVVTPCFPGNVSDQTRAQELQGA
jgi:hypothetical protein